MLTYSFTNIGSESLYQHLYQCIRNDVVSGILPPGTKMPSKRSFALHLGISVMTVESAYSQLVAEGYLYSLPRKGFYVADVRSQKPQIAADVALFVPVQPAFLETLIDGWRLPAEALTVRLLVHSASNPADAVSYIFASADSKSKMESYLVRCDC